MRVVDEANTEARRATIISAALRCLNRNGVAKTSINDICKEAGMRSGHLYYYFESKDAVLVQALISNRETMVKTIEHMFDGNGDLASRIVDVHVDAETRRSEMGFTPILRMELECYISRLESVGAIKLDVDVDRMREAIRHAIRRAVADGRLPRDIDVTNFASAIALIWDGLSHGRISPDFDLDEARQAVQCLIAPWVQQGGH